MPHIFLPSSVAPFPAFSLPSSLSSRVSCGDLSPADPPAFRRSRRILYCAPVEFAVQPDCRPPARYFPGDITVNPGGLQYICRAPWISDPYKLIRSSVPCLPCPRISHQYPPGCSLHSTFQGSIPRSGFPCRTEPHPSPDRQSLSDPAVPGYVPACPP